MRYALLAAPKPFGEGGCPLPIIDVFLNKTLHQEID
jgi:hypothetical protein